MDWISPESVTACPSCRRPGARRPLPGSAASLRPTSPRPRASRTSRSGWRLARLARSRSSLDHVEQIFVLVDLQVLPAAGEHRALLVVLHAPEQRPLGDGARIAELPHQRDPVARIVGMGRGARGLEEGRHPVHGDGELLGDRPGGRARRPAHHVGHADAAFHQVHLAADQRPVVGEALAAIVAGEDDDRVVARCRLSSSAASTRPMPSSM